MGTRKFVVFTCDNCGHEVKEESSGLVPEHWFSVSLNPKFRYGFWSNGSYKVRSELTLAPRSVWSGDFCSLVCFKTALKEFVEAVIEGVPDQIVEKN